jgi:hypothetical protein
MTSDGHDMLWTDQARKSFRDAASTFADAIQTHNAALLALTGRSNEAAAVFNAGDELAKAAAAYADAQVELTVIFPP